MNMITVIILSVIVGALIGFVSATALHENQKTKHQHSFEKWSEPLKAETMLGSAMVQIRHCTECNEVETRFIN